MVFDPIVIHPPAALTGASLDTLERSIDVLSDTDTLILRSRREESLFCRGIDLESFAAMSESDLLAGLAEFSRLLLRLREGPFISIAVVEGEAIGGGVGLAAACDLVVATDQARFGLPEALYGFSPAIVSVILRDRLSLQAFRALALRCDTIGADEAERIGLVDVTTTADRLEKTVRHEARKLRRADLVGRNAVKQRLAGSPDIRQALDEAIRLTYSRMTNPEVKVRLSRMASGGVL